MRNRYTNLALITILSASFIYVFKVINRYSDYDIYALVFEESTAGLMVGSSVTIRGVKVGIIKKIQLYSTEMNKVKVLIKTSHLKNPELLEARLAVTNFMGQNEIDLSYIKLGYVLPKLDGYTQIRVATSIRKKTQDTLEALVNENNVANVQEVGKNLVAKVMAIIQSIENIGQKAQNLIDECTTLSKNAMTSLADIKTTQAKLDLALNNVNRILTHEELRKFLKTGLPVITSTFTDAGQFVKRADKTVTEFNRSPAEFLFKPKRKVELKIRTRSA